MNQPLYAASHYPRNYEFDPKKVSSDDAQRAARIKAALELSDYEGVEEALTSLVLPNTATWLMVSQVFAYHLCQCLENKRWDEFETFEQWRSQSLFVQEQCQNPQTFVKFERPQDVIHVEKVVVHKGKKDPPMSLPALLFEYVHQRLPVGLLNATYLTPKSQDEHVLSELLDFFERGLEVLSGLNVNWDWMPVHPAGHYLSQWKPDGFNNACQRFNIIPFPRLTPTLRKYLDLDYRDPFNQRGWHDIRLELLTPSLELGLRFDTIRPEFGRLNVAAHLLQVLHSQREKAWAMLKEHDQQNGDNACEVMISAMFNPQCLQSMMVSHPMGVSGDFLKEYWEHARHPEKSRGWGSIDYKTVLPLGFVLEKVQEEGWAHRPIHLWLNKTIVDSEAESPVMGFVLNDHPDFPNGEWELKALIDGMKKQTLEHRIKKVLEFPRSSPPDKKTFTARF